MIKNILFILLIGLISFTNISWASKNSVKNIHTEPFNSFALNLYHELNTTELDFEVFEYALKGYFKIIENNPLKNSNVLTIIDMSKSSKKERLFIIDVKNKKLIHKSIVAHGQKSGLEFAKNFSNKINSHKTSLGFYKTDKTYFGKHGLSLRLDGLEFSNNNARKRAIVIHSADYVSKYFIKNNGRLGRSWGCPSLPKKDYKKIIHKIKDESVLFIYYPNEEYLTNSKLVNANISHRNYSF
ncbi:MAG: murein L,D-transpeptidase catalytic domain family protein [Flavobacteriaceae bacterium]|nr:murein L,D-transpeptidase catalytic domain family protein [Flavobacteriaceae bacterium]